MPSHYQGDPYWMTVKFASRCAKTKCDATIHKGDRAFCYPRQRAVYGEVCGHGDEASRDFESARGDEDFYNGVR